MRTYYEHFISWGAMPYYSQHDSDGNIIWSAQFGLASESAFRVSLHNWIARPATPPSISISNTSSSTNVTVYAWWNGATEVTTWEHLGSTVDEPLNPSSIAVVSKVDFETTLTYNGTGCYTYFQVAALNGNEETLGFSDFVSLNKNTFAKADNQTVTAPPL